MKSLHCLEYKKIHSIMYKFISMLLLMTTFISCGSEGMDDPIFSPTTYEFSPPPFFGDFEIPLNNPLTKEGVELGRMLFYEKRLSADNRISCSSCHHQDKAFTDGRAFSKGIDNQITDRSSMSLSNLIWTTHFFWDGRAATLEAQALEPIENSVEMNQSLTVTVQKLQAVEVYPSAFFKVFGSTEITSENIGKALAQFMRTLVSSNSRYDQSLLKLIELTPEEKFGESLFFTHPIPEDNIRGGNCGDCHVNILTSGVNEGFQGFKNNGLDADGSLQNGLFDVTGKGIDKGKFKVPTLRNIAQTAPYMHDGRFATLEDVLDHYNEHVKRNATTDPLILAGSNNALEPGDEIKLGLTNEEKAAIITFLNTLTDETFITNEKHSNPFQ